VRTEIPRICVLDRSCDWGGHSNDNLGGLPKPSERLGRRSEGNGLPTGAVERVLTTYLRGSCWLRVGAQPATRHICHLLGWLRMRVENRSLCACRIVLVMCLALAFSVDLLCVSRSVLAHDIYSNLRDRDGHLCCNGQDCRPVEAIVLPNGNYYLPSTDEVIPADMASPSPDERFHHCTYYKIGNEFDRWGGPVWGDTPITRCFFAPMQSS